MYMSLLNHFRLKTEIDRKDLELSETVTRLTSKHQNEIGDLKYSIQEVEIGKKELQNELNVYKSKLSGDEDSVEELQNKLSQMKLRCEQAERKCSELIEENERLSEDMSSVSIMDCLMLKYKNLTLTFASDFHSKQHFEKFKSMKLTLVE